MSTETDAAALIDRLGDRPRWTFGERTLVDATGQPVAGIVNDNVLDGSWTPAEGDFARGRLVAWSGSLGDDLVTPHPRNWMATGRAAIDEVCGRLGDELETNDRRLWWRPHARQVLSDPQLCVGFLRDHEDEPFDIVLDYVSMLEPSMLDVVEDHLVRAFEMLGPVCAAVVLADATVRGDDIVAVPVGEGVLPMDVVAELMDGVPGETPVVW